MTTIKSIYGKDLEILASDAFGDERVTLRCADGSAHNPAGHHEGRMYLRADLLAALDATANADVKHRADAYADATRAESERDEWKARAEKAEATLDAVAASAREMRAAADRATDGRAKFAWNSAAGWIERNLDGTTFEPAFVLPTEAGAQFTAVHKASGHRETFTTITDGLTAYYLVPVAMTLWTVPQVMRDFTDHRLIGADQ